MWKLVTLLVWAAAIHQAGLTLTGGKIARSQRITTGEVSQVRDDRREVLTETRECISEIGMTNSAAEFHPKGTVVLCRTASAGYSAVMGDDMATSQDFVTWTCGPARSLLPAVVPAGDAVGAARSPAMGSTHKTIYVPDLQMLRIPVPPRPNSAIVESIRTDNAAIDAAIDVSIASWGCFERRQALITAAVTGQIDVTTGGSGPHESWGVYRARFEGRVEAELLVGLARVRIRSVPS